MGSRVYAFYQKIDKKYKLAFVSAFVLGLLVHMYMFTNKLPNHDYVYNIYTDQFAWPLSIGRWFMSAVTSISSYFALPWLDGVLAILYLALTSAFLIDVFELDRPIPVILCSALLASYPAFTDMVGYIYQCDGYMLGVLLATVSVWAWHRLTGVRRIVLATVALCLAAGVYQANVSWAICLIFLRIILDILEGKYENKTLLKRIGLAAGYGAVAMALYYGILLLVMGITGIGFSDYMGVDQVALPGASGFIHTLLQVVDHFVVTMVGTNSDFTAYEFLNAVFGVFLVCVVLVIVIQKKIYRKGLQLTILFVLAILFVPGAYIFAFVSDGVVYRFLMLYSLVLLYMFLVKVADAYVSSKVVTAVAGGLVCVIAFNFAVIDNIAYHNLDLCWEQTMATAILMEDRITSAPGWNADCQLMVEGTVPDEGRDWLQSRIPDLIGTNDINLMRNQTFIIQILKTDLGFTLDGVDPEKRDRILETQKYQDMPCWPAGDSVQVIDGTVVMKLSE